jgi:hypothetical protein
MLTALIITWLFWGSVIVLEMYWRRSWVMWLAAPVALSFVWLIASQFSPPATVYLSAAIHLGLIIWFGVRLLRDRRPNEWERPDEKGEI